MPGPFHSLSISGSGMDVYQTWLDAIADNVANINTVTSTDQAAFQERFVIAQADQSNGVMRGPGSGGMNGARVSRIEFGNPNGRDVYDPGHVLADEDGMVRIPDIELSHQMTHLLVAQRAYQANVSAFRTARDAYQRALEIGRR
ncbi:MAG: flagellar basal body rod C-terminal domain-containing protein [Actinomycetota bacterium]